MNVEIQTEKKFVVLRRCAKMSDNVDSIKRKPARLMAIEPLSIANLFAEKFHHCHDHARMALFIINLTWLICFDFDYMNVVY